MNPYLPLIATVATMLLSSAPARGAAREQTATHPDSVTSAAGLLHRSEVVASPVARFEQQQFTPNPGSMFYLLPFSLSDLKLCGSWTDSAEPVVVQEGTGGLKGSVTASSYMRINARTVVWGNAGFTSQKTHDILWNNSADYPLVGPYVLGDSVGGDLTTRRYSFAGGYAGKHRRWTWGAEASYLASIGYRNRDPRDKIVVSDLNVKAGATLLVGKRYIAGIGADLRVYNQESDVEFYNPNNDIRTYLLTGLGNTYARFSGTTSRNTAYKGIGTGAAMQLLPASGKGFSLSTRFGWLRLTQVLRDYNNLDLTRQEIFTLDVKSAYTLTAGAVTTGFLLDVNLSRRPGFENIFGSSVGNNYTRIGSRRNYLLDSGNATLTIPVSFDASSKVHVDLLPAINASYSHEEYRWPERALETHSLTPSLEARLRWRRSPGLLFTLNMGTAHRFATADRRKLPGLDDRSSLGAAVIHNFDMLTAGMTAYGAELATICQLPSSMAMKVAVNGSIQAYNNHGSRRSATLSASIIF